MPPEPRGNPRRIGARCCRGRPPAPLPRAGRSQGSSCMSASPARPSPPGRAARWRGRRHASPRPVPPARFAVPPSGPPRSKAAASGAQQHDAQVGVASGGGFRRPRPPLLMRPHPRGGRQQRRHRGLRAASEEVARLYVPGETRLTLPGLRTATSSSQARRKAAWRVPEGSCSGFARERPAPPRPAGGRTGRRRARARC